jgi:opacity protein-like surface antigen
LKKTLWWLVSLSVAGLWALPASAQTPAAAAAAGKGATEPVVNMWYAGFVTGTETAAKTGAVFGGEAGARVWKKLDLLLEGGSFGDVVGQSQLDSLAPLTTYLQSSQGQTAAATLKMPALYGGIAGRWVFEDVVIGGHAKPYVLFGLGGARVKREPTFTLAGSDITASLSQYGVTLGADLKDTEKRVTVTGGAGIVIPVQQFYVDLGYRLTSIRLAGGAANVSRVHIAVGARF